MTEHLLDDSQIHAFWDNTLPPRLEIQPEDVVIFECREASDGQITLESTSQDLLDMDPQLIHPLTGPVYVQGARPGDTLEVEILRLEHKGWGWSGVVPEFGLLADDFTEPYLHLWRIAQDTCIFRSDLHIQLPFEPFCGVMGVAPGTSGRLSTAPPRANAGNLDIRSLVQGARLWLPVWAAGALFSVGDAHAAQGDGEVCGTGIECPMTVTLRFRLRKDLTIPEARFETPSPLSRADTAGYFATTAHGPDLYANAQNAIRYMIDYLQGEFDLAREPAYVLCSAAVNLAISEIVDAPHWIVSAYLPLSIFGGHGREDG